MIIAEVKEMETRIEFLKQQVKDKKKTIKDLTRQRHELRTIKLKEAEEKLKRQLNVTMRIEIKKAYNLIRFWTRLCVKLKQIWK